MSSRGQACTVLHSSFLHEMCLYLWRGDVHDRIHVMSLMMVDTLNFDRYSVLLAIGVPSVHRKHLVAFKKCHLSLQRYSPLSVHIKPLVNGLKERSCSSITVIESY